MTKQDKSIKILKTIKVKKILSLADLKKFTGYLNTDDFDQKIVQEMPQALGEYQPHFFTLNSLMTDAEIEKYCQANNFRPATTNEVLAILQVELDKLETVFTHWKDSLGEWCCFVFAKTSHAGKDYRLMCVSKSTPDSWGGFWHFAFVPNNK